MLLEALEGDASLQCCWSYYALYIVVLDYK